MLDSKDHLVRSAVANLIVKFNDLGLLQIIDASKIYIKMFNDCKNNLFLNKLIVFDDFIHLNKKQMDKINKYFKV